MVADAFANGESVYQVAKEHGWAYSSVKKLCRRLRAGTTGREYRGSNGRGLRAQMDMDGIRREFVRRLFAEKAMAEAGLIDA